MVTVTDTAIEELVRVASVTRMGPNQYLRLATPPLWQGDGDFGIVTDGERTNDHIVEHEGSPLLLIDEVLAEQLSKSVFDFKESPQGRGFTLDVY
jgi:Fe-S cluster assembly iron-binding protein IscA